MRWLGRRLDFRSDEDWYSIHQHHFTENFGGALLGYHENSATVAVMALLAFPAHSWLPWKFQVIHRDWWADKNNCRRFAEFLGKELQYKRQEDWYGIQGATIAKFGGRSWLAQYLSIPTAIMSTFPEHEWLPWKFKSTPVGWWSVAANQRAYLHWLGAGLHFSVPSDWYRLTADKLRNNSGGTLLKLHNGSPAMVVVKNFPEHQWQMWKFVMAPKRWWRDAANVKAYLTWLREILALPDLAAFYRLPHQQLFSHDGGGLLKVHGSVLRAVRLAFPDHPWQAWRFNNADRDLAQAAFNSQMELKPMFEQKAKKLGLEDLSGWYSVPPRSMGWEFGGQLRSGLRMFKSLQLAYPDFAWDPLRFQQTNREVKRAFEKSVRSAVRRVLPNSDIAVETRRALEKVGSLEVDIFVESLGLAVECQGEHHYFDVLSFGSHSPVQHQDVVKAVACAFSNTHLVEVPAWWDGREESLRATLAAISTSIH